LFFIFIALGIIAAVVLLVLLLKVDLLIEARDTQARLFIRVLHIVVVKRKYETRREYGEIFTLYSADKKEKRIFSFLDIIKTYKQPNKPKSNEKARGKLFAFINSKAAYEIDIKLGIGLEDAFATAMLCGLAQTVAGSLVCLIKDSRHKVKVSVAPIFNKRSFSLMADCIITLSLANIITGYIIYKINKRR
jgi:hypothetical protein